MLEKAKKHLEKDEKLASVMEITPLELKMGERDVYLSLVQSIVSQQLSTKVADVIFNRFLQLFNDFYPHPQKVLDLQLEEMRAIGLSFQKANYIKNVAELAHQDKWALKDWEKVSDEEIIQYLTQIKGVGKWTVQMILMFSLDRMDVFPVDDLGIQQAMIKLYEIEGELKEKKKQMEAIAQHWTPYRTVASKYLWRWKDTK